jgi:hypothetical protein
MTEAWDGYPENPERDGWHWLRKQWGAIVPAFWLASDGMWRLHNESYAPKTAGRNQDYLGPCLTPAEVEALVDKAVDEAVHNAMLEASTHVA